MEHPIGSLMDTTMEKIKEMSENQDFSACSGMLVIDVE